MKLWKVTCQGMHGSHGEAFVVAPDATEAYRRLRENLDARDLGFNDEREVLSVSLIADTSDYPACKRQLYLPETSS